MKKIIACIEIEMYQYLKYAIDILFGVIGATAVTVQGLFI